MVLVATALAVPAGLLPALPAFAHGAPVQPVSRTAACAAGGSRTGSAACVAAAKANGQPFGDFDNLRVANVNGRDRQVVPDGKLCSGGLPAYGGLDLPRTDWPATTLTEGGPLTVVYKAPIPHEGSFRIYLTKPGYDRSRALRWSDLGATPILTADNPPLRDGAYRMSGKLPTGRSGHQLLYTIWQTTSTPDTYYSCSDLIIEPAATKAATETATKAAAKTATKAAAPATHRPRATTAAPATAPSTVSRQIALSSAGDDHHIDVGRQMVTVALVALAGLLAALAILRIRRRAQPTSSNSDLF